MSEISKRIEFLDYKILKLLNDRMELLLMEKKSQASAEETAGEAEYLERIGKNSTGLMNAGFIEKIYKEIIKESKDLQGKDLKLIAFQGEHGAYGEIAAGAAKMLMEKAPKSSGVVASKLSAELYNLEILKEDINDFVRNITRFLVISRDENREEGDKCSVIFSTEHKAGTLFSVLEVFARENINLTRIGSIPIELGSYAFFLDFVGSNKDENVSKALREVETITTSFKLIGCYKECKVSVREYHHERDMG